MSTWSRRRIETFALSILALIAVSPFRAPVEDRVLFVGEILAITTAGLVAIRAGSWKRRLALGALPIIPMVFALLARLWATPVAFEMTALTVFGATAITFAIGGKSNRSLSLSLVIGGFLVLFCGAISDDRSAIILPMAWMAACVWHLVANHWERLDLAMPESVARTWTLRPATMVAACVVLALGAYAVKDHLIASQRFTFGFMPTSGGSQWSDPAARSGVGTGDSVIAAKDRADSFGAVDSDMFLESTQPTLFDMFNDSIGEAKKRKIKYERRQAMGNENFIASHEQKSRSERGGSSTFSTDRLPREKHHHHQDALDPSALQWDGPTGIRLAMQRYDSFDGTEWSQASDLTKKQLQRVVIGKDNWFFDPDQRERIKDRGESVSVGLLKVIRLDSDRLPVPMMTAGVHIKDIDRQDFFGISSDGSFHMPWREKVPPLTVVHVASSTPSEDEVRDGLLQVRSSERNGQGTLASIVDHATADHEHPYDKLAAIVEHLRSEFTFDRDCVPESGPPIDQFLASKRGGDHLFATTAALMAREIGLQSRLVTGFYVRPGAFDFAAGHASVLPGDVHVWTEVRMGDGQWFEIEPTPGYRQPDYRPSLWLVGKQVFAASWPTALGLTVTLLTGFLTRRVWISWALVVLWKISSVLRPRRKLRVAFWILDARARLAGWRRPPGRTQRDWIEQLTANDNELAGLARQFCDSADAIFFGRSETAPEIGPTSFIDRLSVQTISRLSGSSSP